MTTDTIAETEHAATQTHAFEADVAKLLQMMVHSVYSDKDVFLRELISNAADACEKLRYEAIADPALLGDDPRPRITITLDPDNRRLSIEDNGIGMTAAEMAKTLGTIARSGTGRSWTGWPAAKAGRRYAVDRAVWRGVLFGVHGGRQGRCAVPAGGQR